METKPTLRLLSFPVLLFAIVLSQSSSGLAQGTALTYQGRLDSAGAPYTGTAEFAPSLWNAASGGSQVATNSPATLSVGVINGLFVLPLDFGANFPGADRWLQLDVRTAPGAFTTLSPRQRLTATPYAVTAGNVTGPVSAGQLTGTVPAAMLPATVLTNGAMGVNLTGNFSGNGAGVTNVSFGSLDTAGAVTWPGSFVISPTPGVNGNPSCVVAADVNRDGWQDLISANAANGTLSVLTNNRSGSFGLAVTPGVGNVPQTVTAADIDGDGWVDLINPNTADNTISLLTNNHSGGFANATTVAVGSGPWMVAVLDVNGDGRMDLLSSLSGDNVVAVLTNNGGAGFGLSASLAVGVGPRGITTEDMNGDGRLDLVCANYSDNTLSVLTNNGTGGFGPASAPGVGDSPVTVVAADINGDNRPDLISANQSSGNLTVLTNNGAGDFVLASSPSTGGAPRAVAAADINHDGRVDLICAKQNHTVLSTLLNQGGGAFTHSPVQLGSTNAIYWATTTDVNGDGKVDLIGACFANGNLLVLRSTPVFSGNFTGVFTGTNIFTGPVGIRTNTPAANLHVNGTVIVQGNNNWSVDGSEGDFRVGDDTYRFKIGVATGGGGAGDVWMRAQGGTGRIFLKVPGGITIFSNEGQTNGVTLAPGGGSWTSVSDRNAKENFQPVDDQEVLAKVAALPLSSWNYKSQDATIRHLGPMAQDFHATFGVGENNRGITTVDADGVALAAIQGLNHKVESDRAKIAELEAGNAELKSRIEKLERLMNEKNGNPR